MSLEERIDRVMLRRNPDKDSRLARVAIESLHSEASSIARYVKLAMMPVDSEYTEKSITAGNNVVAHLRRGLKNVSFKFQGSVVANTHIKGASDIDLLVLCENFFTYNSREVVESINKGCYNSSEEYNKLKRVISTPNYEGDIIQEMRLLRCSCEKIMRGVYDICDSKNSKAIKVTNKNLRRDVDVVVGSWYDDVTSILRDKSYPWRGVKIYNKQKNIRESVDYPFQCIELMNQRDRLTNGRLKQMVRFLKTIKEDATTKIDLSSFCIYAICYSLPIKSYITANYLELVNILTFYIYGLVTNKNEMNNLMSVDGREKVITSKAISEGVDKLYNELLEVFSELKRGFLI